MATSIKPAFDGQSLEEFFASFAYKGQGGRHDDSIRKRNSSRGGGGRVDQRIGQGQGFLSPNNNNNTPPPPPPSSSIQSTTNRKKTTMRTLPGILNGLSVAEFIASFAYKGRRVDNRIGKEEDLLNPGTPPPPPPVKHGKRRKTSAAATTARRVSHFFPCPAERVDVKKDITGKGKAPLRSGTKTSAAATTARRVSRFFPCPDERVDVKKDITGKGKAPWGSGTTRKRPRTTGCTDANWQPQKCSKGRRKRGSILLSAEEKYSDAYRRVSDDDICYAPRSSHNLLQER